MSGLSLSEMRRLGEEKNAGQSQRKSGPSAGTKLPPLPGLPFAKKQTSDAPDAAPPTVKRALPPKGEAQKPAGQSTGLQPRPSVETAPNDKPEKTLSNALVKHSAAGGAAGAAVGATAAAIGGAALGGAPLTTMGLGAAIGGMAGAGLGHRNARQSQTSPWQTEATYPLKRARAKALFDAMDHACRLAALDGAAWTLAIDASAAVNITWQAAPKSSKQPKATARIGWPLLACLSNDQLAIIAAHALASSVERGEPIDAIGTLSVNQIETLTEKTANTKSLVSLDKHDDLATRTEDALHMWRQQRRDLARNADSVVARTAGSRSLASALLAQGLVAGMLDYLAANQVPSKSPDDHPAAQIDTLAQRSLPARDLDRALHLIAATPEPTPAQALQGMPFELLERLTAFDMSGMVPALPASARAWMDIDAKDRGKIAKLLTKPNKAMKVRSKVEKDALIDAQPAGDGQDDEKKTRTEKKSLFSFLGRKDRKADKAIDAMHLGQAPLYQADALFRENAAEGLAAYQTLVDAHPRWGLARLRLAEAQIENGLPDGVANLMQCAETLPSALPSIVAGLQSALPMVSPLEEEPLRQTLTKLASDAPQIAAERAEIDLDGLGASQLDETDVATLQGLFDQTPGLREVWVLSAPSAHMPDVPHHAMLGLAPRLSNDAAQHLAVTLAEHAAITGTVAVYIETGKPAGALGDVLAAQAPLWRKGS